jgi:hypothetical protein
MSKDEKKIEWEAKEYITRAKGALWYVWMVVIVGVLSGVAIWLSGADSWSFIMLIVVAAVALVIYGNREPRTIKYTLSSKGVKEEDKFYNFAEFRSFGILNEGNNFSIVLTPRKRFALRMTVYFPEDKGEEIVDEFGERLPMEAVKLDLFDKIVKILRI